MSGWNYFNGTLHGWNGSQGYVPPTPMTLCYCEHCAPTRIPGWNPDHPRSPGSAHHGTGFKCAPWRIGRPCDGCGKSI